MAGSAVVGALRVSLGLDSAQFTTGLKTAQTGLQRFAGVAAVSALAIGTAMIAAGGAVAVAMKGIIDEADKMSKLSQAIGIPIDDLSRLKYAAQLADVDIDALGKGIKRLSAGLLDATESVTGPAAKAFSMLGVSVRDADGNIRPTIQVISDLADRFAAMPDGAKKTALAMRLFGKSGADMIPLLNAGSAGLADMYREAEQLGIILDQKTGKAAEDFNDNLTRMGVIKDGIITKITAGMLPALAQVSEALIVAAKNTRAMTAIGGALGWTLKALATAAVLTGAFFTTLASDIATAASVAFRFSQGDYAGAANSAMVGASRHQETLKTAKAFVDALWHAPSGAPEAITVPIVALGGLDGATRRATGSRQALTAAEREAQQVAADLAREQTRAADSLKRDGQQTFDETRTAAERYQARIAELSNQLILGAINHDTFTRAVKNAKDALDQAAGGKSKGSAGELLKSAADDASRLAAQQRDNLESATYDGIRGGMQAAADGNLGQYIADRIRSALMDRLAGVLTDALMGPKAGNGSKVASAGGGIFSAILGAFHLPGFKTGGSFKVGGSGGADSQLMQFRATPGEMVDIRKPGQDTGGAMAVHVVPSPYFDVQVEKVATPIAGRSSMQAFGAARQQVPADDARRRRFSLTGAR